MEAIILAGGFGTRLRQVVPNLPKAMAPVAGRPFLELVLADMARKGMRRVVLSLGFMADKIQSHFGERYAGMPLHYVVESAPLGTGGGARLAMEACIEDHVFIFNGDTYLDLEVEAVERHWQHHRRPMIIGREVSDTSRYGRLMTDDGRVTGFSEKGVVGAGLINAGCYIFNNDQFDEFPLNAAFSLEIDYLAKVTKDNPLDLFVTKGRFIDIGIPEDYNRSQTELASLLS